MKFYVSCAFSKTSEVVEIAKAADDLGYEGPGQVGSWWNRREFRGTCSKALFARLFGP